MNAKSLAIGGAAVGTLVVLGVVSSASPEFKYHATTVLIVLLGLISLSGIVATLFLGRTEPTSTRAAERTSAARSTTRRGHYTGARR
jgi:protein-S-isoprenylcysteine O-methyltransferase Ste14